ncbi:MAG: hypothetical protein ABI859_11000, partial [Pseudomonadota bacterium]
IHLAFPLFACIAVFAPFAVHADNFVAAHYDARTDALNVTMRYRGTNPDHAFTVRWGKCQPANIQGNAMQIAATVLDDQWNDATRAPFTKTMRFSLAGLSCRPAQVTLHTAPHFLYSVNIPAAPVATRK